MHSNTVVSAAGCQLSKGMNSAGNGGYGFGGYGLGNSMGFGGYGLGAGLGYAGYTAPAYAYAVVPGALVDLRPHLIRLRTWNRAT